MNPIYLSIFSRKIDAVCEEMGAQLKLAAFSPNIRDRLDYSCAVFDAKGRLCAQAAHIPVHLGSMAYAMREIVESIDWHDGDIFALNDPYLGGTHLPDVTVICPVFFAGTLQAFVANRAHYADIGSDAPGSMPISKNLSEEGVLIPPTLIGKNLTIDQSVFKSLFANVRNVSDSMGDLAAQCSANRLGIKRTQELISSLGEQKFADSLIELNEYGTRIAKNTISKLVNGRYQYVDYMEDDGLGNVDLPIQVELTIKDESVKVDFSGSAKQTSGNINCPLSVTAAAVYYVFRCLMPTEAPACAGTFSPIKIHASNGTIINATRPAAVAAGNVETSTRIVDVILGALIQATPEQIPACSQGTMNNLAMGSSTVSPWGYYETIAGGMGASSAQGGLTAVQSHMTNTQNTPVEVLEINYPLRVTCYAIRKNSGGKGANTGGDGVIREFEFLNNATFTILSERRRRRPGGTFGGDDAELGANYLNNESLPAKIQKDVSAGDRLRIETPGGGGWGKKNNEMNI